MVGTTVCVSESAVVRTDPMRQKQEHGGLRQKA
jgi:hypothetical protein